MAVFHKNRLAGYLDSSLSRWLLAAQNKLDGAILTFWSKTSQTNLVYKMYRANRKIKVDQQGEADNGLTGGLKISFEISEEGYLIEVSGNNYISLTPADIQTINMELDETIKHEVVSMLEKVQKEYKSDVLGFDKAVHRRYPELWKEIQDDWDKIFPEVPVEVIVHSNIRNTGALR